MSSSTLSQDAISPPGLSIPLQTQRIILALLLTSIMLIRFILLLCNIARLLSLLGRGHDRVDDGFNTFADGFGDGFQGSREGVSDGRKNLFGAVADGIED